MRHLLATSAGLLALLSVSVIQAEVISITDPRFDVPNNTAGILRPTRGMSMTQVEKQFGPPKQKLAAVGEPPITRWQYDTFAVIFEYSTVIHAVVKRTE